MNRNDNLRGIGMMIFAIAVLSCMDAGLKLLSAHYPPLQIAALRSLASWPLVAVWVYSTVGLRPLLRVRWDVQQQRQHGCGGQQQGCEWRLHGDVSYRVWLERLDASSAPTARPTGQ